MEMVVAEEEAGDSGDPGLREPSPRIHSPRTLFPTLDGLLAMAASSKDVAVARVSGTGLHVQGDLLQLSSSSGSDDEVEV